MASEALKAPVMARCPRVASNPISESQSSCSVLGVTHTGIARGSDSTVSRIEFQVTMQTTESVAESRLTVSRAPAQQTDDSTTMSAAGSTSPKPGRRITSVPAKPASTALQRLRRMRSPSSSAAPMDPKMTDVKLSAVAWAIGTTLKA